MVKEKGSFQSYTTNFRKNLFLLDFTSLAIKFTPFGGTACLDKTVSIQSANAILISVNCRYIDT
ncbi:MAG: hypothetical protein PWP28_401 [Oceanotoga sp.]|nr:hypothetical protein [Oceanotoga sp.]